MNRVLPSQLPVTLITRRMANHAGASGYDRLADYTDARVMAPVTHWTFFRRAVTRSLRFMITRSGSLWYHRDSLFAELCAGREWFQRKGHVFHFLYGENSYRYLGLLKRFGRPNFIVCTYHTPGNKFEVCVRDRKHLSLLDGIIVVSTTQVSFFADLVGPDHVHYIPHGIDVDYFKPLPCEKLIEEKLKCLFVGTHLRDFETLAQCARILKSRGVDFHLSVVTSFQYHSSFKGIPNVKPVANISDEDLLNLYHGSDVFVFPLMDTTANNSLLEAMACGLPVVCTDVPGVRDYIDESCCFFSPKGDAEAMAEAIAHIAGDLEVRRRMAQESRRQALKFSWQKVAIETRRVYEVIAGMPGGLRDSLESDRQ